MANKHAAHVGTRCSSSQCIRHEGHDGRHEYDLSPTQPAPPAQVALLDQEDLDEMSGHLANLESEANEQAATVLELRRRADTIENHCRINRSIAKRVRAMLAERSEATK